MEIARVDIFKVELEMTRMERVAREENGRDDERGPKWESGKARVFLAVSRLGAAGCGLGIDQHIRNSH
jgi:hypothetical protein